MMSTPTRPAVTAIVPTCNRRVLLECTLASVLAQRGVDLEVIVVDDGSSDDTGRWLSQLDHPRIRVLRHDQPLGASMARNAGVDAADTPYVAFCDDDDLWAPDKLAAQLDALSASPGARWSFTAAAEFVTTAAGVELVYAQSVPEGPQLLEQLLISNVVPGGGSSVLAARDLVVEAGGFRGIRAEDWDMWIRLGLAARAASVASPLVAYRVRHQMGRSMSADVAAMAEASSAVRARYREEAAARGVTQVANDNAYLAKLALRSGRRGDSFVRQARLAARAPKKLAWAFAALVSPGAVDRATDRRTAETVPAQWRQDVLEWLQPLASPPATPVVA